MFRNLAGLRFFNRPHNTEAFYRSNLIQYCNQIPNFPAILERLQKRGQFSSIQPVDYNINQFLKEEIPNLQFLDYTPVQLVSAALPKSSALDFLHIIDMDEIKRNFNQNLAPEFKPLVTKIGFYLMFLLDVFNNKLSERNYEAGLPDQENVSEKLHGLEAGKIAALLGLPKNLVLAMLFHDLARPTHEAESHGHSSHHLEGEVILKPLGLSFPYTWYHGYAKYLLRELCPGYQNLLSPVSFTSLSIQNKLIQDQLEQLNKLDPLMLAKQLYLMMLLRLIDDMSKVPTQYLPKNVRFFSEEVIITMLVDQVSSNLKTQLGMVKDPRHILVLEQRLNTALRLLLRPAQYSKNKALHEDFSESTEPRPVCRR